MARTYTETINEEPLAYFTGRTAEVSYANEELRATCRGAISASTWSSRRRRATAPAPSSRAPPRGGRQARHPLRAAGSSRPTSPSSWASTTTSWGRAPHRLERLVHRPRRGAGPRDPQPGLRHRARLLHDGPLLHQPAAARRRAGRGHAPRPRRGREHHPAGAQRAADGRGAAARICRAGHRPRDQRAGAQRLGRRPGLLARAAGHQSRRSTRSCAPAAGDTAGRHRRLRGRADRLSRHPLRPYSSTFDSLATMVLGEPSRRRSSWYDNGWGYAHRVVDLVARFGARSTRRAA